MRHAQLTKAQCDEIKPRCKQCLIYGVACTYDRTVPEMQMAMTGVFKLDLTPSLVLDEPIDLPVAGPRGSPMYRLSRHDRELISKFQDRTILTLGTNLTTDFFRKHFVNIGLAVSLLLFLLPPSAHPPLDGWIQVLRPWRQRRA